MLNHVYIEINSVNLDLKSFCFSGCLEEKMEVKPAGTNSRMSKGYVPEERSPFLSAKNMFYLLSIKLT